MSVHVVILAGGSGTRFWPASRAARPKQLLALGTEKPLIVETIDRVMPIAKDWAHVHVASGTKVAGATRDLLAELPPENLFVEPAARNTAPCIGWAAATIARRDPDAVVVVLPSDHHVVKRDAYLRDLETAIAEARSGVITTIGIRPTRPETGYGYIEIASPLAGAAPHPAQPVVRFVEKPDRARAEAFLAGGKHLWNAGMFVFRAADMIRAIDAHAPGLAQALRAFDDASARGDEAAVVDRLFPTLESVSIDYAIMEKVDRLSVVPADIGWSDVGSFEAAYELADKDARGNATPEGSLLVDADGCLILDLRTAPGDKRVVGLIGVRDLVTVVTDDAVLVLPRERAQDAKLLPQALAEARRTHLL